MIVMPPRLYLKHSVAFMHQLWCIHRVIIRAITIIGRLEMENVSLLLVPCPTVLVSVQTKNVSLTSFFHQQLQVKGHEEDLHNFVLSFISHFSSLVLV